ncbi:MAG: hypothetical protein WBB39_04505 [Candidatus Saccharimonadales bacterium]
MITLSPLIKLASIVLMMILTSFVWYTIFQAAAPEKPYDASQPSPRNHLVDENGDDGCWLYLSNYVILRNQLPTLYAMICNQIYAKNYELTGLLDREGEIIDGPGGTGNTTSFSVQLWPSSTILDVSVSVTNQTNRYYDISITKRQPKS